MVPGLLTSCPLMTVPLSSRQGHSLKTPVPETHTFHNDLLSLIILTVNLVTAICTLYTKINGFRWTGYGHMNELKTCRLRMMVVFLLYATQAFGTEMSEVTGTWANAVPEANTTVELNVEGINGFNDIRYGTPPENATQKSGLGFKGEGTPFDVTPGEPFPIGVLQHYNYPILLSNSVSGVDLDIKLIFSDPRGLGTTFQLTLGITETPNGSDPEGVPDTIRLSSGQVKEPVRIGNTLYTITFLGFGEEVDELQEALQSPEGKTNQTTVWAQLTEAQTTNPYILPATIPLWVK